MDVIPPSHTWKTLSVAVPKGGTVVRNECCVLDDCLNIKIQRTYTHDTPPTKDGRTLPIIYRGSK